MKRFLSTLCCLILCITIPGTGLLQSAADAASNAPAKKKKKNNAQRKAAQRKKAQRKPTRRKPARKKKANNNRRRRPGMNRNRRPNNKKRNTNRNNNRNTNKKNTNRNRPANKKKRNRSNNDTTKREPVEKQLLVHVKTWKETLASIAKEKGKVVVVDVWASWCSPCVKELPNLVALQKKFPNDVVTYSFNIDYDGLKDSSLEKIRQKVKEFLNKQKAIDVKNIVSRDADEKTLPVIGIDGVPAVLVFDRTGKQHILDVDYAVKQKDKDLTYKQHVVPFVEKLVKQK